MPKNTQINLNQTFNTQDIVFSKYFKSSHFGENALAGRMRMGHKSQKNINPVPTSGKYLDDSEYLYGIIQNVSVIGIYPNHKYGTKKAQQNDSTIVGYSVLIPLCNGPEPDEEVDHLYFALKGMYKKLCDVMVERWENGELTGCWGKLTKKQLLAAIKPPYSCNPKKPEYGPSLSLNFRYRKGDENLKKPERLDTNCKTDGGYFHPRDLMSTSEKKIWGKANICVRFSYISLFTKAKEDEIEYHINFKNEIQEIYFVPGKKQQKTSMLDGFKLDSFESDDEGDAKLYAKTSDFEDVDDDDEEDDVPRVRSKRKTKNVQVDSEDEDEDEEYVPTKKRKVQQQEDEEDSEDEYVPKRKRKGRK